MYVIMSIDKSTQYSVFCDLYLLNSFYGRNKEENKRARNKALPISVFFFNFSYRKI